MSHRGKVLVAIIINLVVAFAYLITIVIGMSPIWTTVVPLLCIYFAYIDIRELKKEE